MPTPFEHLLAKTLKMVCTDQFINLIKQEHRISDLYCSQTLYNTTWHGAYVCATVQEKY